MDGELRSKLVALWACSLVGPVLLVSLVVDYCLTHHVSALALWAGFAPPMLVGCVGGVAVAQRMHRQLMREHLERDRRGSL